MFGLFKKKKNANTRTDDELDAYIQHTDTSSLHHFKVEEKMKDDVGVTTELIEKLKSKIKAEEGLEYKVYTCESGYASVGVGRNLETKGLKLAEIEYMFDNDIDDVFVELDRELPHWKYEPFNVRMVLCDMCFNMGIKGLLGFKLFLEAIEDVDYETAAEELLDSKYATQVPNRAKRNAQLILDEA